MTTQHDSSERPEPVDLKKVDELVQSIGTEERHLIPILHAVQKRYHYLPEQALRRITETTDIRPTAVSGVSTFYGQFRHRPAGKHFIKVCVGTACHVKGAGTVAEAAMRHLKIPEGEDTDKEHLFTVEKVACLGCCMLAPAVQIDNITYGPVDPGKIGDMLSDFLEAQKAGEQVRELIEAGTPVLGQVHICLCSSCVAGGSREVYAELRRQVKALTLPVVVKNVGCSGISYQTPVVEVVLPEGPSFYYGRVTTVEVRRILLRHFRPPHMSQRMKQAILSVIEKLSTDRGRDPVTRYSINLRAGAEGDYCGRQVHLATEHWGHLDPTDIDEYLRHGGFAALRSCIENSDPQAIVAEITRSGLRGRGGAGFSTGRKWALVAEAHADQKYVVCNGDEGDPGAFMDRMILESYPFRVLEGLAIAAFAVGASRGFLYIRAEYPLAMKRIRQAIEACEQRGYVGRRILGSAFEFQVEVAEGAGAFVCGEETALMAAIEGRRGMPRFRPPYPVTHGLWGKPTAINNVETLALVSWILRKGAAVFREFGTDTSKGTKVFALAGKLVRGGLVEVPMGITLYDIVQQIGGGTEEGHTLKAIQVGGPSGGCVPAALASTAVDYDALIARGAMMGSGGMVVLDERDCMVDIARYFLSFTQRESCGKCTFCRIGTKRMLEILERLCVGQGRAGDIETLEDLAAHIKRCSLCGLGKTAVNPVLSTIQHFRDEYEAHIEGRCPAHKCKTLIEYVVTERCIGCTKCAQQCPVDAIQSQPYQRHNIDADLCTRCDACRQACPENAIEIRDAGERRNSVQVSGERPRGRGEHTLEK